MTGLSESQLSGYLNLLGLEKKKPSLAYLREIHFEHLLAIPYENIGIHYNQKISLEKEAIFKKIYFDKRGGYVFEQNLLLYYALISLSFEVDLISAQIKNEEGYSRDFGHMLLQVYLENAEFILDVGSVDGFHYPKKLEYNVNTLDYTSYYRFETDVDGFSYLTESTDALHFSPLFKFEKIARLPVEFYEMNEWYQTSQDSYHKQTKVIRKKNNKGSVLLTDKKLVIKEKGEKKETDVNSEIEFFSHLEQFFKISYSRLFQ